MNRQLSGKRVDAHWLRLQVRRGSKLLRRAGAMLVVLSIAGSSQAAGAAMIADSVSEFSNVQGQDSWHYGYIDIASGPTFIPFTAFQTDYPTAYGNEPAWVIDAVPTTPPFGDLHFLTYLRDDGGSTNALLTSANKPREHWVDRRWISDSNGTTDISGIVGDFSAYDVADQDGVLAEILVDGALIWSLQTDGHLHEIPYATSATVSVGSIVDFLVKPGATDGTDQFTFTAQIRTPDPAGVPEASSAVAWMVLAGSLLGGLRRRRGLLRAPNTT